MKLRTCTLQLDAGKFLKVAKMRRRNNQWFPVHGPRTRKYEKWLKYKQKLMLEPYN